METTAQTFGALLKSYRSRARISQEALAEHAQLSVETISALERGTRRAPYRDTVSTLATALALSSAERTTLESAASRSPALRVAVRPSLRPVSGPSGNVPQQLTSFVGRATEVAAVDALLAANRLVTLTGSGGVGKTRVALQIAADQTDRMADGVWFVELASLADPALIPGTIVGALRSRLPADGDPLGGLCALIASKRLLLVLDNCEHMIAAVGMVATALLLGCPHVALLVTSRQALRIAGEATLRIPSLAVPDPVTAAAVDASAALNFEALKLFVDRARAVESRFVLTDQDVPIVADICRRLDGIPLAIELAATRIKILSPSNLRDRLDERFRILTGGNRGATPRQQALRALIDWSYDLLDEGERRLFRRVGVFADGFTLDAATAICGEADSDDLDVLNLLASLVDKSLILATVAGDVTRYHLLESTRMYALEMLAKIGEREELDARHLRFFCDTAARAERALETTGSDVLIATLAPDLDNVRAALRHAAVLGDVAARGMLAVNAARMFGRLGLTGEGIRWLETAIETVEPSDLRLQSRIWSAIAYLFGSMGGARSLLAADRGVALAQAAGDRELVAWALIARAATAMDQSCLVDAEAALTEAAELFGPNPKPYQQARLLAVRHYIAPLVGDISSALQIGEELRALYRQLGNELGELRTAVNDAESLHALGETRRAIALVHEISSRAAVDRETQGFLQLNLTAYLAAVGDAAAARAAGAEAIGLLAAVDRAGGPVATAIGHLALAHALAGDATRAARLLGYWSASSNALGVRRMFTERTTYEKLSAILAERLSPSERQALLNAGAALAPQDAIAEALRS